MFLNKDTEDRFGDGIGRKMLNAVLTREANERVVITQSELEAAEELSTEDVSFLKSRMEQNDAGDYKYVLLMEVLD